MVIFPRPGKSMAENSSNRGGGGGRAHKFTSSDPHFDSFNSSLLYDRKIRIFETAGSGISLSRIVLMLATIMFVGGFGRMRKFVRAWELINMLCA